MSQTAHVVYVSFGRNDIDLRLLEEAHLVYQVVVTLNLLGECEKKPHERKERLNMELRQCEVPQTPNNFKTPSLIRFQSLSLFKTCSTKSELFSTILHPSVSVGKTYPKQG